jgi:transposase
MLSADKEVSMHVVNHHDLSDLRQRRRRANPRLGLRIQIIILASEGRTAPQIAASLGMSRRNLQAYIHRYNQEGLAGLEDRRRGSNYRLLSTAQEQQVTEYLDSTAADPRAGVRRGEDLRVWIERRFGVLYTLPGIYALLHRLGYSSLMPRPRHAQADPQAQAEFKKKRWSRSHR